jgi:SulP family sulfate permease
MLRDVSRWIPAWGWIRNYRREDLMGDVNAGLTVAVMLIPQGMAYAMLAGLPPIMGLYASIFPLLVYALLGTSRQLAVGPVAMVSLLVATGVGNLAGGDISRYIALAVLLAGMVGIIQISMGLLRLGFLVNFLSHPVINGFTSAAALIIGLSQIKHLLGVDIQSSHKIYEIMYNVLPKLRETHLLSLLIGLCGIIAMLLLRRWKPSFPCALAVVLVSTFAVWIFGLDQKGVTIVGSVPSGFPALSIPQLDWNGVVGLWPVALVISFVGFMESISVAKALASRHRYQVNANQELMALGAANIAGAFSQGYAVAGGFSRTAVNAQAGGRTGLASLITASLIAVTLLFLTPLFYYLPNATLAAIVIVAVASLVDWREPHHLWQVKRSDALLLGLTFLVTLSVGIKEGIAVGVLASLGVFIYRTTNPHVAELGRLPGTETYRNLKHHPEAERYDTLAILRIDTSFYFANIAFFRDQIARLIAERGHKLKSLIIDATSINDIDSSAEQALREIHADLQQSGINLYLAGAKWPLRNLFHKSGLREYIGQQHLCLTVHDAVKHSSQAQSITAEPPNYPQ